MLVIIIVHVYYGGIVLIDERCYGVTCVSIYRYESLYYIVVGVDNVLLVCSCRVRLILFISLTH